MPGAKSMNSFTVLLTYIGSYLLLRYSYFIPIMNIQNINESFLNSATFAIYKIDVHCIFKIIPLVTFLLLFLIKFNSLVSQSNGNII